MDNSDRREIYESAIKQMDEYIARRSDGTLFLRVESGAKLGIDPVVFADLKRSIEETNRKIKSGEIEAGLIE